MLCHVCYSNRDAVYWAWDPRPKARVLPDPPPIRRAPPGVRVRAYEEDADCLPVDPEDGDLPDRLAVLPRRPWRLAEIRLIAAVPRELWQTVEVTLCLLAFGWEIRGRVRRWYPPKGWEPE